MFSLSRGTLTRRAVSRGGFNETARGGASFGALVSQNNGRQGFASNGQRRSPKIQEMLVTHRPVGTPDLEAVNGVYELLRSPLPRKQEFYERFRTSINGIWSVRIERYFNMPNGYMNERRRYMTADVHNGLALFLFERVRIGLETLNGNPPQPSKEIDDVNATPKAGTPIAPHEDGPIDPFDEPVSLGNEEIETIQARVAAHSEAKKPDNLRTEKRTHADVSVSPDSDDNTQNDSDVSVLSLGQVIDSMSLEQDGSHSLITSSFQKTVAPLISNTSGNRSGRPVPRPRRVLLNAPFTVAQRLSSEPKPVESSTIQKPSSKISNGSGIAPVMNGNVSTPKRVEAVNEIHETPSGPGMTPHMSANTSIASSSSTRRTRFTGPAADEKLRRQREEAEKQLQKV
uniref:Uncharacterized protein n=1 Tax=Panagrolaimus davidi TaxID=227884 RepID=A0A914PR29_9BILA